MVHHCSAGFQYKEPDSLMVTNADHAYVELESTEGGGADTTKLVFVQDIYIHSTISLPPRFSC